MQGVVYHWPPAGTPPPHPLSFSLSVAHLTSLSDLTVKDVERWKEVAVFPLLSLVFSRELGLKCNWSSIDRHALCTREETTGPEF